MHLSSCARAHAYSIHRGFLFHPLKKPGFMPFFKTSAINTYSNKKIRKKQYKTTEIVKCITAFYPFCGFVHPRRTKNAPPPHAAEGRLVPFCAILRPHSPCQDTARVLLPARPYRPRCAPRTAYISVRSFPHRPPRCSRPDNGP